MKPDQIKTWLKEQGKDRAWLAAQCGVSKPTVDGWMSGRNIPGPAQSILTKLLYSDKPIAPKFSMEQFARIQRLAKADGLSLTEFVESAVIEKLAGSSPPGPD